MKNLVLCCFAMLLSTSVLADGLSGISNFRQYDEHFSSSGQPTPEQLQKVADAGYDRVVYIAYSDHKNSLANEDRLVKKLGMEYLHIPVEWDQPTVSDFDLFVGAMQRGDSKKTLLHCQVNFRASAFALLYRVIHLGVPLSQAKKDMNSVWTPNKTWTNLILQVLAKNDIDANCDGCDWTPGEH
ncbi:MAG: protein tyrosine phosphatase family protein [Pseudomonadota bacterium]